MSRTCPGFGKMKKEDLHWAFLFVSFWLVLFDDLKNAILIFLNHVLMKFCMRWIWIFWKTFKIKKNLKNRSKFLTKSKQITRTSNVLRERHARNCVFVLVLVRVFQFELKENGLFFFWCYFKHGLTTFTLFLQAQYKLIKTQENAHDDAIWSVSWKANKEADTEFIVTGSLDDTAKAWKWYESDACCF